MNTYTIEVPINSHPLNHLTQINEMKGIRVILYGGIPNSPFNGGRNNFILDRQRLFGRVTCGLTQRQLRKAFARFYENIDKANASRVPFLLALTNMFISKEELNDENLAPVDRLVAFGRAHNVKNGLILNNRLLEDCLRQRYGGNLIYVSSCTKYCIPKRIFSPQETLPLYLRDSNKYDYITLTPQDSRREKVIKDVVRMSAHKIIAICNSYCSDNCNCYDHYKHFSYENKKSLLTIKMGYVLVRSVIFVVPRFAKCGLIRVPFRRSYFKSIADMQLRNGIVNFKLGRGYGDKFLDNLVAMIREYRDAGSK